MQAVYSNSLLFQSQSEPSEGRVPEMAEKEKKVVVEDSCSEDEESKGANKNSSEIESTKQFLKDTNDAQAEMTEKKKQSLSISHVVSLLNVYVSTLLMSFFLKLFQADDRVAYAFFITVFFFFSFLCRIFHLFLIECNGNKA